jgi:hypothetical protein
LLELLQSLSEKILVIQFLSRHGDLLPFIRQRAFLKGRSTAQRGCKADKN